MKRKLLVRSGIFLVLLAVPVPAQVLNWNVKDASGKAVSLPLTLPSVNLPQTQATSPVGPIKIDSGTSAYTFVAPTAGLGLAGNWMRFAVVNSNTKSCDNAAYNSYPNAFYAFTPIYLCIGATADPNRNKGWYAASLSFKPQTGQPFSLPIQLTVSPTGYLQLGSSASLAENAGDYNDHVFAVGVKNNIPGSIPTVYAAVKDSNGTVFVPVIDLSNCPPKQNCALLTQKPDDDWIKVTWLGTTSSNAAMFQISVDPSSLPPNQSLAASKVVFTAQGVAPGESNIYVNATVTLPPPTLTAGVSSISFGYPGGPLSQVISPQSSGALIPFTATAVSDDGTGWLSVAPQSADTQTQLTVSAAVNASRPTGTYTGKIIFTPTDPSISASMVGVSLQVGGLTYRLTGVVSDVSGYCSSGASIGLSGATQASTLSDLAGNYSFSALPAGQYVITPSKAGCSFTPPSIVRTLSGDSTANNFTGSLAGVTLISPSNGATGVASGASLVWSPVAGASSYDVYFGTGNPSFAANVTGTSWTIAGTANQTYSWRIDARNSSTVIASSATWSFAAAAAPAVTIQLFSASPPSIPFGGSSTLSWAVTGAASVSIDPDIGAVALSGNTTVKPGRTTTYTLTAMDSAKNAQTATAMVTVSTQPPSGLNLITATPNPILVQPGTTLGQTTIAWNAPSQTRAVEVHINAPDGPTVVAGALSGTSTTGIWVNDRMTFYLQDVSNGNPLVVANTLDTVTVRVIGAGDTFFGASPLYIPAGQATGTILLMWNAPSYSKLRIRVGSSTGTEMTGDLPSIGWTFTGNWVQDGLGFFLQDASSGVSSGDQHTVQKLVASVSPGGTSPSGGQQSSPPGSGSGSFTASPNPIIAQPGRTTGKTTLSWNEPGYSQLQILVGSATGQVMTGSLGSQGSTDTGDWVSDQLTFYLQNAESGSPIGANKTVAQVTVSVATSTDALMATPAGRFDPNTHRFGWTRVPDAAGYELESDRWSGTRWCSDQPGCVTTVIVSSADWAPAAEGTYRWRVRAFGKSDDLRSAWTSWIYSGSEGRRETPEFPGKR